MNKDIINELKRWVEGPIYDKDTGFRWEGPFKIVFGPDLPYILLHSDNSLLGSLANYTLEKPLDKDTLRWVLNECDGLIIANEDLEELRNICHEAINKLEGK